MLKTSQTSDVFLVSLLHKKLKWPFYKIYFNFNKKMSERILLTKAQNFVTDLPFNKDTNRT